MAAAAECPTESVLKKENNSEINNAEKNKSDKYSFLSEPRKSITSETALNAKNKMYKAHIDVSSKLGKLKSLLNNNCAHASILRKLYLDGKFEKIEESVNGFTKKFILSQLKDVEKCTSCNFSVKERGHALSIYIRNHKFYRYLTAFFSLPCYISSNHFLYKIHTQCGVFKPVLEYLKLQTPKMNHLDCFCTLQFGYLTVDTHLDMETNRDLILGFEDLGPLGRNKKIAEEALVFMIRGIRLNYNIPVAHFFVDEILADSILQRLIIYVIQELQKVGIKVCAIVCEQNNSIAVQSLVCKNENLHQFVVNGERIAIICDVNDLILSTRNALIKHTFEYAEGKYANIEHIKEAFRTDNKRKYKWLLELSENDFNFNDEDVMLTVDVAAKQLSYRMAVAIETSYTSGQLEPCASDTAEFCDFMGNLYDSLNCHHTNKKEDRKYLNPLSKKSPHIELWAKVLPKLEAWKDLEKNKEGGCFELIEGWEITIKSVMSLWRNLQAEGLHFLSLRNLNQGPLINLFNQIIQNSDAGEEPSCFQFEESLRVIAINSLSLPSSPMYNNEETSDKLSCNFQKFLEKYTEDLKHTIPENVEIMTASDCEEMCQIAPWMF